MMDQIHKLMSADQTLMFSSASRNTSGLRNTGLSWSYLSLVSITSQIRSVLLPSVGSSMKITNGKKENDAKRTLLKSLRDMSKDHAAQKEQKPE